MNAFPEPVREFFSTHFTPCTRVAPLSGLSGARVWRVFFAHQPSVIVKTTEQQRELLFYDRIAPHLAGWGISTPERLWSATLAADTWLILEDIPVELPRSRWLADEALCAYLRRLHQVPLQVPIDAALLFEPNWTMDMNERALAWFPQSVRAALGPALQRLHQSAQHLFAPQSWVSGDPNPTNWGVRADGSLVLFDWERFGSGAPALDLAITVPGLGNFATFSRVARIYAPAHSEAEAERLARDIALAKIWSVTEFLSMFRPEADHQPAVIGYLQRNYPAWVEEMHEALDTYLKKR